MREIKYISASPDELYFAWQVEVMLDNFINMSVPARDIQIVIGINKHIGEWWFKLIEKYKEVGFYFYEDTRDYKKYPPSIRPHILYKHWERFPWLQLHPIFYHDCDIVFTRKLNFEKLLKDEIWYLSDTKSYIDSNYIDSKSNNILQQMCKIMNLRVCDILNRDYTAGGAQYIMKNVFSSFWKRVQYKSEKLYEYLSSIDSDIQKWTSDMWALLWSAWYYGFPTNIVSDLSFSMATDTRPKWNKNPIYHNAGAVEEHKGKLFIKNDHRIELPYIDHNPYDKQFCSSKYFDLVIETGKNSCLKKQPPDIDKMLNEVKSIFI